MRKRTGMGAAAAALLLCAGAGSADELVMDFNQTYPGKLSPAGPGPWLKATFSDEGDHVKLVLDSIGDGSPNFKIFKVYLNVSALLPSEFDFVKFDPALPSPPPGQDPTISRSFDSYGDGGGPKFDIEIAFFQNHGLPDGHSAEFRIEGVSVMDFYAFSPGLPLLAGAHIGGLQGGESTWITPTLIPLPAPVYLGFAGLGLAAGVSVIKRRR